MNRRWRTLVRPAGVVIRAGVTASAETMRDQPGRNKDEMSATTPPRRPSPKLTPTNVQPEKRADQYRVQKPRSAAANTSARRGRLSMPQRSQSRRSGQCNARLARLFNSRRIIAARPPAFVVSLACARDGSPTQLVVVSSRTPRAGAPIPAGTGVRAPRLIRCGHDPAVEDHHEQHGDDAKLDQRRARHAVAAIRDARIASTAPAIANGNASAMALGDKQIERAPTPNAPALEEVTKGTI